RRLSSAGAFPTPILAVCPDLRFAIAVRDSRDVSNFEAILAPGLQEGRADRHLAVAAGDVEYIGGLAEAGDPAAQSAHQLLPLGNAHPEMPRAASEIAVVQVVRLDPVLDEGPQQSCERFRLVVDAAQQHALAEKRDARVGEPGTGASGGPGELVRMVGVDDDIGRLRPAQCLDEVLRNPHRIDDRNAAVDANDPDVIDDLEAVADVGQPSWREDERIAAAQNYFPDLRVGTDIVQRRGQLRLRQRLAAGPDPLAAKAEPAIYRAHMNRLQQDAVGIAVDDALDRRM